MTHLLPHRRPAAPPAPAPATPAYAVELTGVSKVHPGGVRALDDVSLTVAPGTFLAVVGPSGSGKSTLMHCAAGLDTPTSGRVSIGGRDLTGLSESRRTELRRDSVGFVFQAYNLLPSLSVADNITLPLRLAGATPDRAWLRRLVERVGLADRLEHRPGELSGGQQQRAAIARALVARPAVVFADEPTGALDTVSGEQVLDALLAGVREAQATLVMVTHDNRVAAHADREVVVADGLVESDVDSLEMTR